MRRGYQLNHARLRKARERKGYTSTEAAARAGISERQLQRFEVGKQEPRLSRLCVLLDIYDIPLSQLSHFIAPVPSVVMNGKAGAA